MNGVGNDYIYINLMQEKVESPSELAKKLSDRHFSIGGDGIVLIDRSDKADFSMKMYNADGSESGMCGNAIRCVAKYVYDKGLTKKNMIDIETPSGIKSIELYIADNKVIKATVNMGRAKTGPKDIPTTLCGSQIINYPLPTSRGDIYINCVFVGNPHTVIFVDNDEQMNMALGEEISNHRVFPERTNVEFVRIIDEESAYMRVYERGTGETLGCGTGASAAFYVSYIQNKLKNKATIHLIGGDLQLKIHNGEIYLTGDAQLNYEGEVFV
jgi:diaminopimelate epimerase